MQIIAATFFTAVIIWLSGVPVAAQSAYPDRPVRIIVTFAPGSATDITARVIAQKLSVAMGRCGHNREYSGLRWCRWG